MNTIFTVAAMAVILTFSSCSNKGISDELKGQLHAFETDWKATGVAMTNYGARMTGTFDEMQAMMDSHQGMPTMEGHSADNSATVDSLMAICNSVSKRMDMIKTSYNAALSGFADDEAAYKEWKSMIQKKEIKEEDTAPGLNDFNVKLSAYKDNMEAWKRSASELESRCKATCTAMENLTM